MQEDIKNIQNETLHIWQRILALENYKASLDAVFQSLRAQAEQLEKDRDNLKNRIQILEEARQRQIAFNTDISKKVEIPKTSFWFRK